MVGRLGGVRRWIECARGAAGDTGCSGARKALFLLASPQVSGGFGGATCGSPQVGFLGGQRGDPLKWGFWLGNVWIPSPSGLPSSPPPGGILLGKKNTTSRLPLVLFSPLTGSGAQPKVVSPVPSQPRASSRLRDTYGVCVCVCRPCTPPPP